MPYADLDTARVYQREYRRIRRAGECTTQLPTDFRLQTAADVLALVEEQVAAVRTDAEAKTLENARTIGFLAGVASKAVEAGNVAARLEAVEVALKRRKQSNGRR